MMMNDYDVKISPTMAWDAYHGWSDGTDQIDGFVAAADEERIELDLHALTDEQIDDHLAARAKRVWADGGVLTLGYGGDPSDGRLYEQAPTVLVPGDDATLNERNVREALRRWHDALTR